MLLKASIFEVMFNLITVSIINFSFLTVFSLVNLSDQSEYVTVKPSTLKLTKKRKQRGRVSEARKQLRARSHALGEDYKCIILNV